MMFSEIDNEELPRMPPEKQQINTISRAVPLVPEVTLYQAASQQKNPQQNKSQQNVFGSTSVFGNMRKQQLIGSRNNLPIATNQLVSTVPDVSLLDHIPNQRKMPLSENLTVFPKSFQKSQQNYSPILKENLHTQTPKPLVPEVTMYEPKKASEKQESQKTNLIFDDGYKKHLMESHQHFMKQMQVDSEELNANKTQKKTIFNSKPVFNENPLSKYAPRAQNVLQPISIVNLEDSDVGNSSSILIDVDKIIEKRDNIEKNSQQQQQKLSESQSEEETYRKVAEMLTEMQKFAGIGGQNFNPGNSISSQVQETDLDVLKRLASKYLTEEEFKLYQVEKELNSQINKAR